MLLRSFLFLLFAALGFAACTKGDESNLASGHVWIRFQNQSLANLSDAYVLYSDMKIGNIPALSTSDYIMLDSFQIGDGLPFETVSGLIGRDTFYAFAGGFCGTGLVIKTLDPGEYTIALSAYNATTVPNGSVHYFHMEFQN